MNDIQRNGLPVVWGHHKLKSVNPLPQKWDLSQCMFGELEMDVDFLYKQLGIPIPERH